jgi:hypothetical protein
MPITSLKVKKPEKRYLLLAPRSQVKHQKKCLQGTLPQTQATREQHLPDSEELTFFQNNF